MKTVEEYKQFLEDNPVVLYKKLSEISRELEDWSIFRITRVKIPPDIPVPNYLLIDWTFLVAKDNATGTHTDTGMGFDHIEGGKPAYNEQYKFYPTLEEAVGDNMSLVI